ncbi:unnamed protein product [Sphenostylis stenocarpa]|uniref:Peptidyl-tRNA hydrolase n=1 Tax=Sphenostylis stenocarpa TaxID=92480 RepID=A0AA86SS32_9FABA|nr:unnamed protein product [Sphenostylis stenocarpa]
MRDWSSLSSLSGCVNVYKPHVVAAVFSTQSPRFARRRFPSQFKSIGIDENNPTPVHIEIAISFFPVVGKWNGEYLQCSIEEMLNRLSRRCFCTFAPRPWLFVGLGNPGDKYKGTRHNVTLPLLFLFSASASTVGFEMIDAFAESQGIPMNTAHSKAIFGKGFVGEIPVFLAKPQTYMNLSGESIDI